MPRVGCVIGKQLQRHPKKGGEHGGTSQTETVELMSASSANLQVQITQNSDFHSEELIHPPSTGWTDVLITFAPPLRRARVHVPVTREDAVVENDQQTNPFPFTDEWSFLADFEIDYDFLAQTENDLRLMYPGISIDVGESSGAA